MDLLDDLRLLDDEVVVAAVEPLTAEVVGRQPAFLHLGPHRAVEHHHLGSQRVEVAALREVGRRPRRGARATSPAADGDRLGRGLGQAGGQFLERGLADHPRHDQLPPDGHDVHAADALEPAGPLDDLERNLEAFLLRIRGSLEAADERLRNPDPGNLGHHPRGAGAPDGRDADEERRASERARLVERLEILFERVHVVDEIALEELRAGVRLLQLALRLGVGRRGAGRRRGAQEQPRRIRDAAAVEPHLRVAHAAQDPQHLDRVHVPDVHAAVGSGTQSRVVAGQAEHVADAEGRGAEDLGLQSHPGAVARRDLHHRLDALLDGERRTGERRHARRGRRVVGEVRGVDVVAQDVQGARQLVRGDRERRRHFAGHDELPGGELLLERRSRLVRRRRVGLIVSHPPDGLPNLAEERIPERAAFLGRSREALHRSAEAPLARLLHDLRPRLAARSRPVEGRQHLEQLLRRAAPLSPLVDAVPDAGPRRIDVAAFRGRAAAGPVSQPFRALHRADEGRFLEQAVPAHAAAEQRALDAPLEHRKPAFPERSARKRVIGRLEAAPRRESRHPGSSHDDDGPELYLTMVSRRYVSVGPDAEWSELTLSSRNSR